jgi:hypothetical protein
MTTFHAGVPMERFHLDFLGSLPTTKNNNSFILMMVDQFTKWVECIPLPSQTTEETARVAINNFFSRFDYPLQIFTDRRTNFTTPWEYIWPVLLSFDHPLMGKLSGSTGLSWTQ